MTSEVAKLQATIDVISKINATATKSAESGSIRSRITKQIEKAKKISILGPELMNTFKEKMRQKANELNLSSEAKHAVNIILDTNSAKTCKDYMSLALLATSLYSRYAATQSKVLDREVTIICNWYSDNNTNVFF